MPNPLESLYNQIKGTGVAGKNYGEFQNKMADAAYRQGLYNSLTKHGAKVGANLGEFEQKLGYGYVAPSQPQQKQKPTQQAPQPTEQPQASASPQGLTWQDQMAMSMNMGRAQSVAENAAKGVEALGEASKKATPFGSGNVGLGNNNNLRKGQKTFDAEKGAFVDTYLTSDGRKFNDVNVANQVQDQLDDNAANVRFNETMKSLGVDVEADKDKDINHLLGEAYAERDRLKAALKEDKEGEKALRDVIMSGGYDPTPNRKLEERSKYTAALRMLDRRIDALETARDKGGFWVGVGDVLTDPSSYSFGLTDLEDAKAMQSIYNKVEEAKANGLTPNLTDSEKALARNFMLNEQAQGMNKDNFWHEIGQSFGQTLSFMKDFALTGGGFMNIAKAGMNLGAKGGAKLASKALGDYMTKNLGTRALGKMMYYGGKGLGLAAGAEVGGLALNNTAQAASSVADIMNKQMGKLTVGKDGNLSFEDSKKLGDAVLKSQLSRGGENASELVGLAFDAVPGILGKYIQRTKVGQFAKKIADSKYWKGYEKAMNYLGVQSVWGEGMEEEYNMARDVLIGESGWFKDPNDPNKPAFFDGEQQLKTWETVGITSMLLRVPSMIATGTQQANYYANQYNLNTSDRNMRDVFGDAARYESVKSMMDGADNAQLAGVLNNLMNNAQLSREEKEAMFMYANDLVKLRGFNIGNVVAAANGFQEQPKVSSYAVKGNSFDELDADGNVLAHHEYETNDEMKAGLYEAQQKRFDENINSDISVMKARPDNQYATLVESYSAETGIEPAALEEALAKPSLERTDAEQQIVTQFAKVLHDAAYDNTMLHEEQSVHDGESAADESSIDIENPDPTIPAEITAAWQVAQENRNALFAKNEDLMQEVTRMENEGFSHQEIISALETFRPEEQQTMIEYYNQQAKFQGFMNRMSQKIDEEAANSRERHAFKGTINGNADLSNVYTITDGTNEFFLVSGNITTDPEGRITGSGSGLIIGMDLDGSFVNIGDTNGYSVMPVTQTLDQWEEAERARLQEQMTATIDPTGSMMPQEQSGEVGGEAGASTGTGANEPPASAPAIDRIPKDEGGNPLYEQAAPEDTYDAFVEQVGENTAKVLAKKQVDTATKALEKLNKKMEKGDFEGNTIQEQIASSQALQQQIAATQATINYWNQVLAVPNNRILDEANNQPVAGTNNPPAAPETPAGEAPEWRYDTPEAARGRGYKVVEGQRIDRQEEKPMPQGMEVEVQFSTKDKVKGHMTVSELGDVQGSHLTNGQVNEKHFLPEAQPKSEFGADRQAAAQANASEENFRPELMLTFNGTQSAYSGSASQTNRRGEVIQGNGRRNLAEYIYAPGNEAVAKRYKDFLKAHAEELGTTPEAIEAMEKPFAHIVLDVTDEEAIRLGQFTAADLESGGKKIPEVSNTITKLGDNYGSFTNILLRHEEPDATLGERVDKNMEDAISWLNRGGYINNTEAKSLLEDKDAARQFLKDMLTDVLFRGANPQLRTMFYELPTNIQNALVSVVGREVGLRDEASILKDIQESIQAYHELMASSPQFAGVKGSDYETRKNAADNAVEDWLRQINLDGSLNTGKFSNFALELAKLYRCLKDQKTLASRLKQYYDIMSGAPREVGMFDEPTAETGTMTREQALEQIFGVKNGTQRNVSVAGNNQAGQGGTEGGTNRPQSGEREEGETGPSESGGGDTGNAPEGGIGDNPPTPPTPPAANNTPLTPEEIDGSSFPKQAKTLAKAYLNGNHGELQTEAYNDIYDEVRGGLPASPSEPTAPAAPQQPITSTDPIEAINQAEQSFREGQNQAPAEPSTPPTPPAGGEETLEQKRARLKAEILAKAEALKKEQVKNMREDMSKMGMNRLTPSFIPRDKKQRKMFWDLVQTTADYGYTYIQEGITNFDEWRKRLYDDIVEAMREIFQWWGDKEADGYIDAVWNSEVEADGKTQTLAEFAAEKSKNANEDMSSVNVNKEENNETENDVPLQQEALYTLSEDGKSKKYPKGIEVYDYSDKAIAVFGVEDLVIDPNSGVDFTDLDTLRGKLDDLGSFNPRLKDPYKEGGKWGGYIVSKKKAEDVERLLQKFFDGTISLVDADENEQEAFEAFKYGKKKFGKDTIVVVLGSQAGQSGTYLFNEDIDTAKNAGIIGKSRELQRRTNGSVFTIADNVVQKLKDSGYKVEWLNIGIYRKWLEREQNNNDNGQKDNQPAGGQTAASNNPTHGESPRPTSHVGQGTVGQGLQNGGSQQQGSSRVSQVSGGNSGSGGRSDRRLQGLNKNNNHEERGTESAPSTPRMRTQANIEAIRLMQQIIEEDRPATDEEKKILRKFSGWGGLGVAFEDPTYSEELRSLLGDAAYDQAQMSRNSAYFTPANIIDAMWDIAKALGFKGGNVLEGSAGIGKIIGLMPSELSDSSNIQAVEIDETTGNILKLLYPDAQVDIQGFEDTKIPNGSIDLAITNVPFVTGLRVQDTTGDKDLSKKFHDIHDFCIAKNIRKLREGGIGIFITSNGTLDNSQKLRDWIISEGNADVVGAFRLNNKTFGGTGTTSDIIVVRKRVNGQKSPNAIDVSLPSAVRGAEYDTGETKKVKGQEVPVIKKLSMDYNGYFVEHPEHMGGEMVFNFEIGETYRPTSKTLAPSGVNQDERLDAWVNEMSNKDWSKEASAETTEPEKPQYEKYGEGVKEGSLILDSKGNICIAQYGEAVPLGVNDKKVKGRSKQECLKDYNAIKNALNEVLNYQVEHEGDEGLQPLLDKLNKAYNQFVAKYGHFHSNTAIAFLRNDVDYASVGALETYKEKTDKDGNKTPVYGKADVFSRRVVEKEKEPKPKTIKDGVIASIYMYGGINIPYIAEQLGMTEEEAKDEILEKGLGFENPDTTQVEVSYVYLSGNVREKLEKAKVNNVNGKYAKNISALEKIIPNNIPAHLIEFNLGSTWIDKELYKEFFKEKTGKDATFNDANGTWFLGYDENYTPKDGEGAVFSELCDKTILTSQLIEAAMTGRTIKVQKTEKGWDGKTETITDNEATQACAARIDELKQDFKDWARAKMQSDPEIAEKAEKAYNEKFNNYVPMTIPDEFAPSRFGGQVTELGGKPFGLRPHQSKAVIKGITQPVLLAHEVGTGKTFTLITTAMEMRRIGTAKKPMIVVQNATVGQFTESAKALYPNAKILTMDEKDHSEAARKQFYAKIKYNDWDLIIVPQSVLDKIPDSPDRQLAYINEKIQEKERILYLLEQDPANWAVVNRLKKELEELNDEEYDLTEASAARSEKKKKRDEKKRAVAKQNAAVRAKEQLDRSVDDVEDFDDMEIDAILVDEAHGYKKLGFGSVMQKVKGVDTGSSKKCASLLLKTRAVLEKSHGKNVVFATGTPVSNTAAEVWTFMRYLMPEEMMEEYGIKFFDDFARNFGNVQQMLEFTTSGKFKENNRFAGYVNMPELARIWRSVADIVLTKEAGAVQEAIPELEGGKATDIYLPQTKALRAVMKFVRQELERYENMSGKEKKANSYIPLVMYGIAKAAAVDARLVDSTAADEPQSKTNEAVRQTLRSLEETKEYNGTVAIFADNYQNKQSGFNLYEDIKKKLIAQGVPAEQIAIIRSDMSDKKKLDIFDKVNSGEIRVVMGSTQTLGTGVNIQERLHTLIHMDAPNRPMDYTQRNGRELRQGNLHREWGIPVRILRFGVEDSLDVTAYQRLKTKGAIADSVMNAKKLMDNAMDSRVLEEEEDVFGDTVAQLSGSEYAMLKNQAEKEVRKLEARYKQWEADQIFIHAQMPRLLGQSDASRLRMEKAEKNLATVEKAMKEPLKIEINGKAYDSLDAMADFFKEYNSKVKAAEDEIRKSGVVQSQDRKLTVTINGIPFVFKTTISGTRSHENGKIKFSTMRQTTFNNEDLIGGERNAKGGYIKNGVEEILNDYLSGNDYREIIETEKNVIARNEAQIKMLEERSGKEFAEGEALEKARERLEEYTQKMKEEMEAKEAKYKEMDAEVEASDSVSFDDDEDNEQAPKRMISSHDPMEAINQASESWRQERKASPTISQKAKEVTEFINSLSKRFGIKGGSKTYVINSVDDIEALRGTLSDSAIDVITNEYNEPDVPAAYLVTSNVVVIFGEKVDDVKDAEIAYWHEQAHSFWSTLPEDVRNIFGEACLNYLERNYPLVYRHIKDKYSEDVWLEEACSFLMGEVVAENGTAKLLNDNFAGNEIICNFANGLRNYIKYGKQRNNQLRRDEVGQGSEISRRSETGQGREGSSLRPEEEQIVDPLEAIEQSAKRWIKRRKEAAEESEALKEYSAKEVYNQRVNTAAFVTSETFQDGMIGLKTAQNAIAHDKEIPDSQNAYMAENLMHGKSAIEQEMFDSTVRGPLLEVVNRIMQKTGMSYDDIDKYTLTKSGLERNREFFVRDWFAKERRKRIKGFDDLSDEAQEIFDKLANRIETDFEDGIIESEEEKNQKLNQALQKAHKQYIDDLEREYLKLKKDNYQKILDREMDFPGYLDSVDAFIRQNIAPRYKPQNHDYSGLTALYGDENGKYDEAGIIDNLMDTEKKMGILSDILWSRINIASQYGLDRYRQAGMRSDEQLDKIEQMFHWYVPMRGFKEDTAEDMYQYFTSTNNDTKHLGGLIRHAKGRSSEAFSPIVSLINMSYKAITDCNQNMVNQKLYRLVQANPNDLIVLSDSWAELDQNTGEWEAAYPQIPEDATEEEVRQEVMAFEEDMKQKALEGTAKKIKGKADFDYKPASKKMKAQHTVEVYLNGQRKLMTIVGNPRAAEALNGQTRFKADLVPYISDMNTAIKNWMSKASTSYNPTFAARNMLRDWTHFKVILITREGTGYASAAGRYYKPTSMMSLFKKYRQGQLDESVEEERDFKDFMDNGGTTGFIHMMKMESLQKDMQKQIEKMQKKGVLNIGHSALEGILGAIEAANEAIENAARFATYRASRHYAQRTKARSAYDAKEVTANFNRRGSGIRTAGFKSNHTKKISVAGKKLFEYKDVEAMARAMGLTSQILGEGRMFFNATLQAVATIFKNFKNPDGSLNWPYIRRFASRYAATSFIMSNLVTAANMALVMLFGGDDGDDPYANLPEWVRRKNICLWLGWIPGIEKMLPKGTEYTKFFKDDFLTIPIGQELAAFYSLGDLFAGLTYAPNLKPVDLDLYNEFVSFLNVFSPVDFETKITEKEGLQRVFPEIVGRVSTVLAPTVAISENVSWTGRRIFRADKFEGDEDIPEYLMAYNSTNGGFVSISKWLNDINGDEVERGSIQVNPGQMQYFVEQYGGGPAKLAMNTGSFAHDIYEWMFDEGKDANFNVRKVEIGKAFVQQADENQKYYRTRAKYEKYRKEANILERKIKKYAEGSVENPDYLLRVNELTKGVDAARMDIINSVENDLKKVNKMIMSAKGDERKRLNDKYNNALLRVVNELDKVQDIE